MGVARCGDSRGNRLLYFYGGTVMTEQEKRNFDKNVRENKCWNCRRQKNCNWFNDYKVKTCFGVFYKADGRKRKKA